MARSLDHLHAERRRLEAEVRIARVGRMPQQMPERFARLAASLARCNRRISVLNERAQRRNAR